MTPAEVLAASPVPPAPGQLEIPARPRRSGRARSYVRHQPIAAACRQQPGTWVHVRPYPTRNAALATASYTRTGHFTAYQPAGAFDAEVRPHPDGHAVWARHTPTQEPS